jgi:CubicO group peptidase (beta-lactamase class C family)
MNITQRLKRSAVYTMILLAPFVLLGTGCGGGSSTTPPITESDLGRAVSTSRTQAKIPAMYAVEIDTNSIVVTADGVRKQGSSDAAQKDDRVHLGSNTKAMTASLIALYVESGTLRWDMKLTDIFPEFATTMRPEYKAVTVEMLLELRAGLLAVFDKQAFLALPTFTGSPAEQRKAYTQWVLQQPPDSTPGEYNYSNSDYVVAAAVLEKVTGKTWDDLLQ